MHVNCTLQFLSLSLVNPVVLLQHKINLAWHYAKFLSSVELEVSQSQLHTSLTTHLDLREGGGGCGINYLIINHHHAPTQLGRCRYLLSL